MSESLSVFFQPGDGFTVTATLSSGSELHGIFDINTLDLYADGSPSVQVAQFVCADYSGSASLIGQSITLNAQSYYVQNAVPDGTGLITLTLVQP